MRSGRKNNTTYLFVEVRVECDLGHVVGTAIKQGTGYGFPGDRLRFEDLPSPTSDSGRVRGKCSRCGADVQLRWARVLEELNRLESLGRHSATMRP